jgi:L-ascorbate metabolism protein UlaG (beta-lactamase superfamily)
VITSPAQGDVRSPAARRRSRPVERLTWVGHATVLFEVGGARLLTDPMLRSRLAHLRRQGPPPPADVAQDIDAVLISHVHLDHLHAGSLRMVGRGVRVLAPHGSARLLARMGFAHVDELRPGDCVEIEGAVVTAVPAVHDGHRHPLAREAGTLGFEIAGARRSYFAGDTELFDGMRDLAGDLDVALLPIWGWGPKIGPGHMDPRAAAEAAAILRPRVAVPIHWGTLFPVGLARTKGHMLVRPPVDFVRHVAELAPDVQARVLAPGDTMMLDPVAA